MVRYAVVVLVLLPLLMRVPVTSRAQEARPLLAGTAIATPVSPGADITTEVLAEIRLPAATIPASPAIVDVWLVTLAPGEAIAFETGASPPSIVADIVLGGALIVRSAGRVLVQRAAGLERSGSQHRGHHSSRRSDHLRRQSGRAIVPQPRPGDALRPSASGSTPPPRPRRSRRGRWARRIGHGPASPGAT